jgi:predicted TPR repeat methyltransferase
VPPRKTSASAPASRFDEAYFSRYYGDPRTRVVGAEEVAKLVRAITSLASFWGLPLRSALDLGAGIGLWKTALAREAPRATYRGVDLSKVACAEYGHEPRDISRWRARGTFDLVVCQGVLQYLGDDDAAKAIENIAAMAGGLLYLEVLTKHDVDEVADLARTDAAVNLRTGAWYRKRLSPHFVMLGCGLWHSRKAEGVFFELERAGK